MIEGASSEYEKFLSDLTGRIKEAQLRAGFAVNRELIVLYWQIGREIQARQQKQGYGAKVIERIAADLRRVFPEMRGFSTRNLQYMRALATTYPDAEIAQQLVAQVPWGHNVLVLDKIDEPLEREWYLRQTIEYGWSRDFLAHQIESRLYYRQGKAIANFARTLPPPQSDLAQQTLKDPYMFDFLTLGADVHERDLARGLLVHIREFLLELGVGFAFVGSQYHIEVGGQDFYLDLLFYHLRLRCYVVIDLKVTDFQPAFAGQMNFYLSAVDDLVRHPNDQPTIGLILCKTKNAVIAEYALRDMNKPMGVSVYQLTEALPDNLQRSLPTIEELEAELGALPDAEQE